MRAGALAGISKRFYAIKFGLAWNTVNWIVQGKLWRHVI
jgi:hypothetical protein